MIRWPLSSALVALSLAAQPPDAAAQCDRVAVLDDYAARVTATRTGRTEFGWTGDADSCVAGDISALARENALTRINYFRDRVGLGPVAYDGVLNARAQEAALMMHAERSLSHTPGAGWACYTADGALAASRSNLALGAAGGEAVMAYMHDRGGGNEAVGHRRWILYSRAKTIGQGFTDYADAMWVIGNNGPSTLTREYMAWPTPGVNPAPAVPQRWSFSMPGADFSAATVTMVDAFGDASPVTVYDVRNGFGDNTIAWEVARDVVYFAGGDASYTVTVGNVVSGGQARSYTYTVTVSNTNQTQDCGAGLAWSDGDCACVPAATSVREAWAAVGQLRGRVDVELYDLAGRRVARGADLAVADLRVRELVGALGTGVYVAVLRERATGRRASVRVLSH